LPSEQQAAEKIMQHKTETEREGENGMTNKILSHKYIQAAAA
jgi:hypothetical protein